MKTEFFESAELSDMGRKRKNNEDACIRIPDRGVFCVADGMGGQAGGDLASEAIITALQEVFSKSGVEEDRTLAQRVAVFTKGANQASKWIKNFSDEKVLGQMGSTIVALILDPQNPARAMGLHAGDSRLYRMRGGELRQITEDHSAVNALAAKLGRDPSSIPAKYQNELTRCVGLTETVELERTPVEVRSGDLFLICSDGLTKMVADDDLAKILKRGAKDPVGTLAQALISAANEAGGKDNVTAVLVRFGDLGAAKVSGGPEDDEEESMTIAPSSPEDPGAASPMRDPRDATGLPDTRDALGETPRTSEGTTPRTSEGTTPRTSDGESPRPTPNTAEPANEDPERDTLGGEIQAKSGPGASTPNIPVPEPAPTPVPIPVPRSAPKAPEKKPVLLIAAAAAVVLLGGGWFLISVLHKPAAVVAAEAQAPKPVAAAPAPAVPTPAPTVAAEVAQVQPEATRTASPPAAAAPTAPEEKKAQPTPVVVAVGVTAAPSSPPPQAAKSEAELERESAAAQAEKAREQEELRKLDAYRAAIEGGRKALAARDYEGAAAHAEEALASKPGDPAAVELGERARRLAAAEESIRKYKAALQAAQDALAKGEGAVAVAKAGEALAIKPDDPAATLVVSQAKEPADMDTARSKYKTGDYAAVLEICGAYPGKEGFDELAKASRAEQSALADAKARFDAGDYDFIRPLERQPFAKKLPFLDLISSARREMELRYEFVEQLRVNDWKSVLDALNDPASAAWSNKPNFRELAAKAGDEKKHADLNVALETLLVEFSVRGPTDPYIQTPEGRAAKRIEAPLGQAQREDYKKKLADLENDYLQSGYLKENDHETEIKKLAEAIDHHE
jgi:protein phosphatase